MPDVAGARRVLWSSRRRRAATLGTAALGVLLAAVAPDTFGSLLSWALTLVLIVGAVHWVRSSPGERLRMVRELWAAPVAWWRGDPDDGEAVAVDAVRERGGGSPRRPVLQAETSTFVIGQTGTGKSTFAKGQIAGWEGNGAVVAHALSEPGRSNEFVDFFEDRGREVIRLSSRDSDLRWDPFLDLDQSLPSMENLAEGVFESRSTKRTGWSEPARTLLLSSLVLTSARHDDFARLPDVLERGPEWLVDEIGEVPGAELVAASIREMDGKDRKSTYTTLLNQLRPLLASQIFDEELERLSMREYLREPSGRVVVLDHLREDRFARSYWRHLVQSAVDFSMSTAGRQRFVLDEVDKLPKIDNLAELASAGRSAGSTGLLVAQDAHQLAENYDDMSRSIWSNCPNRVAFRAGDEETAELVLSSLGEVETTRKTKTRGSFGLSPGAIDEKISTTTERERPIPSGRLTTLETGEALVQSPSGWWLAHLSEPPRSDGEAPGIE